MSTALPTHPSLVHLRDQAKKVQRDHREGVAASCRVLAGLKRFQGATDERILAASVSLQEVQLALALSYGFLSWAALRARVETLSMGPRSTDYNRFATRFDEDAARREFAKDGPLAERLSVVTRRPLLALDVGCGTGNFILSQTRHFGPDILWHGVDPAPAMLEIAKSKNPDALFALGGVEHLPYADGTFDYVATTFSIHHWGDKAAGLDEIRRVIRADGMLRVEGVALERSRGWWVYRFFPEALRADELRFWTTERQVRELELRGWAARVDTAHREEAPMALARLAGVEKHRHFVSSLVNLTDAQFRRGVARIRAALAADPGGSVPNEFVIERIEADRKPR